MTILVPLEQLAATLEHFASASLVTLTADTWPKIHTVDPVVDGDALRVVSPAPSVYRNVATNPLVTLIWQPTVHHGHTLLVDGWAVTDGEALRIRIDHAMLHRPAAHADGPAWVAPEI